MHVVKEDEIEINNDQNYGKKTIRGLTHPKGSTYS